MLLELFVFAVLFYFYMKMSAEEMNSNTEISESETENNLIDKIKRERDEDKKMVNKLRDFKKQMYAEAGVLAKENKVRGSFVRSRIENPQKSETEIFREKLDKEKEKDKIQLENLKSLKKKLSDTVKQGMQENQSKKVKEKEMKQEVKTDIKCDCEKLREEIEKETRALKLQREKFKELSQRISDSGEADISESVVKSEKVSEESERKQEQSERNEESELFKIQLQKIRELNKKLNVQVNQENIDKGSRQ